MEFRTMAIAALIAALASPAAAQRVVGGDTIEMGGARWRLWGIDAPETPRTPARSPWCSHTRLRAAATSADLTAIAATEAEATGPPFGAGLLCVLTASP
jgi:hypothetical protein